MTKLSDRKSIRLFADGYRYYDKIIKDYQYGFRNYPDSEILGIQRDIARIESAVYHLSENDHLIIYHEVILGKTGNWYLEYYSESTYRRRCKVAYANFLRLVEH